MKNPIALKYGFSDIYYFSNCFKRRFGISPTGYRERETQLLSPCCVHSLQTAFGKNIIIFRTFEQAVYNSAEFYTILFSFTTVHP
ncbi:AraC family transcriptional regulator [Sporofaciens musculi]|uniref:AraC family transcriptional regulator n=1 Tax=Sporofaciens musculi TaxID=2681861 RepID=UPI003FA6DAB4